MKPVNIFSNTRHIIIMGILALGLLSFAPSPAKAQEIDTLSYVQMDEIILDSWAFTDDVTGSYIKFDINNEWPAFDILQVESLGGNDFILPFENRIVLSTDSTFINQYFDTTVVFEDSNDVYPNWKTCDLRQSGLVGLSGPIWMSLYGTVVMWDSTNVSGNSFIGVNGVIEPHIFDFAVRLIVKRNETVGIQEIPESIPSHFTLHPAYPNPFNPSTAIRYALPEPSNITLVIFDISGREVMSWSLIEEAGLKLLHWDGTTSSGRKVPSGIYLYRLVAESMTSGHSYTAQHKMVLLK